MRDLDQQLLDFNFKKNYEQDDFFISSSNYFAYKLVEIKSKKTETKIFMNIKDFFMKCIFS